jgi:hypothetical protein
MERGDKFVWHGGPGQSSNPVYIEVTRVARDGSWADIWCGIGSKSWTKRQRLPLPPGTEPKEWTRQDLLRTAARARGGA